MTDSAERNERPLSTLGRLRALLVEQLGQRGIEIVEEHPDHLVVLLNGQQHSVYLSNLARALDLGAHVQSGRHTTPSAQQMIETVHEWLDKHLRQIPSRVDIEQSYRDLDRVRSVLLPRVIAPAAPGQPGQRWSRPLCDDLLEVGLVIDQPDLVTFATPDMVAGWGVEHAEAIALGNLRKMVSAGDFRALNDAGSLRMCATSDSYASARALLIEELFASDPTRGVLLALPSRDLLFAEAVCRDTVRDIAYLALLARKSVGELPYPLSGEVFWVRNERWEHIPIHIADGQMDVDSPEAFAEVLQRLMADEK